MVYKKRLVLCILVVIITSSILMNYEFGKGINNSEIEEPKLRNPIPIFLPTFFYIWEDRLYFQIEDDFYQYDISDKSNITYLSEIKIESYMSRIKYYENKMFSFTNIHNEIDDNYVFKIDIYELNENNIEKTRSINYQRDSYAHVLYVSQEYIVIRDYDSPISPVFIIDIGQPNPVEYPIEFSGDTSSPIDDVILDNDLLYILSVNVNWNQTSLLIFDVENLANPILIGSWSTYSFSNIFPNLLKKEDNKLYICTSESIAIAINITEITNPTEIGRFTPVGGVIRIVSNFAIVIKENDITIYNITNIESSIKLGNYTTSYIYIIEEYLGVFDGLFIANDNFNLLILDWSNPEEIIALDITKPVRTNNFGLEINWLLIISLIPFISISKILSKRKRKIKKSN